MFLKKLLILKKIEALKDKKNQVIKSQQYEEAAKLRDDERKLQDQLEIEKKKWEEDSKAKRISVTEDNVAEVVSMMCGIPVTRIAQKESGKLVLMAEELRGKVIGQDEAVEKVVKAIQRNRAGLKRSKQANRFIFLPRANRCW
jgi:ATP-dependent Clp protease ATP-binding subunit ClpC